MEKVTEEQAAEIPDWAKRRALAEINYAYESIAGVAGVPLDVINRVRPDGIKYHDVSHIVQEYTARAGAMADLAVTLRLITPADATDAILRFQDRYPEM